MTDLLTPEDTGDVAATRVIFHQTADTAVIRLPESPTRRLTAPPPPPLQALRLGDSHPQQTGEIPAWPTGAEAAVAARPAPVPRATRHALTARAAEYPVVRPKLPAHIARRRAAERRDRRARAASLLLIAALWATVALLWAVTP